MARHTISQDGAALLTVLLLMAVILILITTLLVVSTHETVISGLHRDGARSLELAQAGLSEAVHRIREGRPYWPGFPASLEPAGAALPAEVSVMRRFLGANAAYLEIRSEASVGRAKRRLGLLVRQHGTAFPPGVTLAGRLVQRAGEITCGDVYARGPVQYRTDPNRAQARCPGQPPTTTYAGWRISLCGAPDGPCAGDDEVPPCYRAPCPDDPAATTARWFPATRVAVPLASALGGEIAGQVTACEEGGGGPPPASLISGRLATEEEVTGMPAWGFDRDDPDAEGPVPPQAVIPGRLPCGMPYRYVLTSFEREDGTVIQRYVKTVVLEHWLEVYWRFDERAMALVKRNGSACTDAVCLAAGVEPDLVSHPQFGAVPPFPAIATVVSNFDCRVGPGGTLNSLPVSCAQPAGQTSALGCKVPQMSCPSGADQPAGVVLEGDWTVGGALQGHGLLAVTGGLSVAADLRYWGTVVTASALTLGAGGGIYGTVVVGGPLVMDGAVRVEGSALVPSLPTGPSAVVRRGWWER